jgi:nitroreductase
MFEETLDSCWNHRFGQSAPSNAPKIGRFLAHRSVRDFTGTAIPETTISTLIAAAQSASTSSNLQLWTAISVQDPERRLAIAKLCADQRQVKNAAWFFAFFADHARIRRAIGRAGEAGEGLDFEEFKIMAIIDAAIAAERMVCAAESLGIGTCYIGALRNDPAGVRHLLGLPNGLFGAFGLCLGWPDEALAADIKPRFRSSAVWHRETYCADTDAEVDDYDERMRTFYESQAMKGEVTWSMRSGRRLNGSPESMSGREVLRSVLEDNGFGRR